MTKGLLTLEKEWKSSKLNIRAEDKKDIFECWRIKKGARFPFSSNKLTASSNFLDSLFGFLAEDFGFNYNRDLGENSLSEDLKEPLDWCHLIININLTDLVTSITGAVSLFFSACLRVASDTRVHSLSRLTVGVY